MRRIHFIAGIVLLLFTEISGAQALKRGDVVPDVEVTNVYNFSSDKLNLSQFKKKLIIFDFWSTSCWGCIKSFPKMDSLQRTFKDEIQIVLINKSSKDSTKRFFDLRNKLFKPNLPFITNDTLFQTLFPHQGEPYYVLLDSSLRIQHMPDAITFASLRRYLKGEDIGIHERKTRVYVTSPINEKIQSSVRYSSFLFNIVPEAQLTTPNYPGTVDITVPFASVALLYAIAFDELKGYFQAAWNIRPGKVHLEMADTHKYIMPEDKEELIEGWIKNYAYSYQLIVSENQEQNKFKIMREDLKRCFDLRATVEKRKVKCLTLIRTSTRDKLKAKGGTPVDNFVLTEYRSDQMDAIKTFANKEFHVFSERLSGIIDYNLKMPFRDATGFDKKKLVSFQMPTDVLESLNLASYRSELKKYDLDLIEKEWLMDVLVLREKGIKREKDLKRE